MASFLNGGALLRGVLACVWVLSVPGAIAHASQPPGDVAPQGAIAVAGEIAPGGVVLLDAAGSTDLDGDRLSYRWTVVAAPAGSNARPEKPHAVTTSLPLDAAGRYVVRLDVSDGLNQARPDTVVIDTAAPSFAKRPRAVLPASVDQPVVLDGMSLPHSANADAWQWSLLDSPPDSVVSLYAADTAQPSLRADRPGRYVVQAVVDAAGVRRAQTVTIVAEAAAAAASTVPWQRPVRRGLDSDGDGIDDTADNCIDVANADQRDTDGDLFGNVCDPDLNNDFAVNFADLQIFEGAIFSTPLVPEWNPDADFNGDDAVNFLDLQIMKQFFFGRPGPSGTLPLLNCGDLEPRSIDAPGDGDFFQIAATAGSKIALTVVETAGFVGAPDPRATLYAPNGDIVGQLDADSQVVFDIAETGTYLVNVRANDGITTGEYNLGLVCLSPPTPVVASLACGTLLADEAIDIPGQTKLYTFDGMAGDTIALTLVETSGFIGAADPRIWLYTPSGAFVGDQDANSQIVYTLPETGTYVVRIAANQLIATGSFNLGLVCLDPAGPIVSPLGCGGLTSDAIDLPGQTELYSFDGTAGDQVALTIVETSGFVGASDPRISLYTPSGTFVGSQDANSQIVYTLAETGTYTVRVAANELVSTGTFNLGLVCLAPASPIVSPLACGALLTGEAIDSPGQTKLYSFGGTTGDQVALTIVETSGFVGASDPRIALYTPGGTLVGTQDANSQIVYTLAETGTYTVRVAANELVSTGTFNLGLVCLNPPSPIVAPVACGGLLVDEVMDTPGQTKLYSFDGTAGEKIGLTLAETSGFVGAGDPRIELYAPSGAFIGNQDAPSQIVYTLAESGTHVVRIAGNNLVTTGTYNFGVVCFTAATPLAGTLTCGSTLADALNDAGETDLFTFDATAGVGVTISLTETSGFVGAADPRASVYSPTTDFLTQFDAPFALPFVPVDTGTHLIRIAANDLSTTGTYEIGLACP